MDGSSLAGQTVRPAAAGDQVVLQYYYPSTATGQVEANLNLYYYTGSGFAPIYSSGNVLPQKDSTDNLDGSVSGGRFTVVFDTTSKPTMTQLTSLRIAAIQGTVPPPESRTHIPSVGKQFGQ
jgi:hypothetical protein